MDALTMESVAEKTLQAVMHRYAAPHSYRTLSIFDHTTGNYLLMDEGWEKYRRIYRVWAHVEIKNGKFWIHEDGTEEGIASLLLQSGTPSDQIVLAFDAPNLRAASEFAVT